MTKEAAMTPKKESTYTLYLDESGDHGLLNVNPAYPVLALCGVALESSFYSNELLPRLDQFKVEHLGRANVGLHYRAMAQKAGPFKFLADPTAAWSFGQALGELISGLDLVIFCAVINKLEYVTRYGRTRPVDQYLPTNLYLMALDFVLERFVKFLEESRASTAIALAEARGRTEDAEVAAEYRELLRSGTQFVSAERFRRVLAPEITFAKKSVGTAGLELADVCAAPIATRVLKPDTHSPIWQAIRRKVWVGRGSRKGNLGLKCFPRSAGLEELFDSLGEARSAGNP